MHSIEHTEPPPIAAAYRRVLRNDFSSFIARVFREVNPGTQYQPNWHIDLIAEYLEAARRGEIQRLIINMPPRMLKSICVSVAWPAWLLGHMPNARIIGASYAEKLSLKHSLDCRAVIESAWYRRLFPRVALAHDQNEKHKYMTTQRGYRMATSVGGVLTGEGGNFLIIDDPLSPAQADSRSAREAAARWFDHTFSSRLDDKNNGVMVLVMQRLHAEDLTAHLLEKGGWVHCRLPALADEQEIIDVGKVCVLREKNEPLHRMRENALLIERAKRELGSYAFSAQYQQKPVPQEGGMIKPWWLARYAHAPLMSSRIVQCWDTAVKAGAEHDESVCLTFAEHENISYLIDALAVRLEYPYLKQMVVSHAERFAPHALLIEDKASGSQLLQDLRMKTSLPLIARNATADKITRLAAVSALIEGGRVRFPSDAVWLPELERQLLTFPATTHDDYVDALSHYLDWIRSRTSSQPSIRTL